MLRCARRIIRHTHTNITYSCRIPTRLFHSTHTRHTVNSISKDVQTIETLYQRKTPIEHVLLRPDTYVGGVQIHTETRWKYDDDAQHMIHKNCTYVPGFLKMVDEIFVNASDNIQRDRNMSKIDVRVSMKDGEICVMNDGRGLPIRMHQVEKMYVPELVMGHLLTGSNFDDTVSKVTGGRSGYGAKLTNIFSKRFILETGDSGRDLYYRQEWRDNMTVCSPPLIEKLSFVAAASKKKKKSEKFSVPNESFTRVRFYPDFEKFGMKNLDKESVAVVKKRVIDLAGCTPSSVKVSFNGKPAPCQDFASMLNLYGDEVRMLHTRKRWQVGVALSESHHHQHASFVNGICTTRGGTHLTYVTDQITSVLAEHLTRKHRSSKLVVQPHHVKSHISVFVNCKIENPAFDSQTKEALTTPQKEFGSSCTLPKANIVALADELGISEAIVNSMRARERRQLSSSSRKSARVVGVPKLEDAVWAGSVKSAKCTLILTEGDSAKALAVAGLSVVGREQYGVFPLRGKMLNVRDASTRQVRDNVEIGNIVKILGLDFNKTYESDEDMKSLRYGKVMIMADQDLDGSHIKGLFINMVDTFWPYLLRRVDFLQMFVTPIVKASLAKQQKKQATDKRRDFFSIGDFNNWWNSMSVAQRLEWRIKYYKGLGTSTAAEGKEYFKRIDRHCIALVPSSGDGDGVDQELLQMAFNRSMASKRKEWLLGYDRNVDVDYVSVGKLSYSDFVNKVLIHFSAYDNERSIPNVVDGLKPSQRKVLYACLTRPKSSSSSEVKVAQLASYVAEKTSYHHGEVSLQNTIVNMAQDFVGSNNVPLLQPLGQFGTRHQGGKDSASPRYTFTRLQPWAELVYPLADLPVLSYREDDGKRVEPWVMSPVVPVVLLNGCDGVGTGWSTSCPSFHPLEVIENVRRRVKGKRLRKMDPWTRGFRGTIAANNKEKTRYVTRGCIEVQPGGASLRISELPVRTWTEDYHTHLEKLLSRVHSAGKRTFTCEQRHTDTQVEFVVRMSKDEVLNAIDTGLHKYFRLESSISLSNMHLFDAHGVIKQYTTPLEVIEDFFPVRHRVYELRHAFVLSELHSQLSQLEVRHRFVESVLNGEVVIHRQPRERILSRLSELEFDEAVVDQLLAMSLSQFTKEKASELHKSVTKKRDELDVYSGHTVESLWLADLDRLENGIREFVNT